MARSNNNDNFTIHVRLYVARVPHKDQEHGEGKLRDFNVKLSLSELKQKLYESILRDCRTRSLLHRDAQGFQQQGEVTRTLLSRKAIFTMRC